MNFPINLPQHQIHGYSPPRAPGFNECKPMADHHASLSPSNNNMILHLCVSYDRSQSTVSTFDFVIYSVYSSGDEMKQTICTLYIYVCQSCFKILIFGLKNAYAYDELFAVVGALSYVQSWHHHMYM